MSSTNESSLSSEVLTEFYIKDKMTSDAFVSVIVYIKRIITLHRTSFYVPVYLYIARMSRILRVPSPVCDAGDILLKSTDR